MDTPTEKNVKPVAATPKPPKDGDEANKDGGAQ